MSFDFRVFVFESDVDKTEYISECYYDDDKKITGYVSPEHMNILAEDVEFYLEALKKPKLLIRSNGEISELIS